MCTPADINECDNDTLNECHVNANCNNTVGNYSCECEQGFTGDGINCQGMYISFRRVCIVERCPSLSIL